MAKPTVFLHFDPVRVVFLVFFSGVVSSFAFSTG